MINFVEKEKTSYHGRFQLQNCKFPKNILDYKTLRKCAVARSVHKFIVSIRPDESLNLRCYESLFSLRANEDWDSYSIYVLIEDSDEQTDHDHLCPNRIDFTLTIRLRSSTEKIEKTNEINQLRNIPHALLKILTEYDRLRIDRAVHLGYIVTSMLQKLYHLDNEDMNVLAKYVNSNINYTTDLDLINHVVLPLRYIKVKWCYIFEKWKLTRMTVQVLHSETYNHYTKMGNHCTIHRNSLFYFINKSWKFYLHDTFTKPYYYLN